MNKCFFCDSVETRYCKLCDKWMCVPCKDNYPERLKAWAKGLIGR